MAIVNGFSGVINRFGDGASDRNYWVLALIPIGLAGAWLLARTLAPETAGDGVAETAEALAVHGGQMRARVIPTKIATTALTLGTGGSAGREGPIVQIGAAIGSFVGQRFGMGEAELRSLVAAGAAAGIGATFNAPIAGMLFALEVILRSFSVRHMSAIVIASVVAAVTSRSLARDDLGLHADVFRMGDARELFLYVGLALLIVILAVGFLGLIDRVDRLATANSRLGILRPVGLGLLVAVVGFFDPRLLGTGQEFANQMIQWAAGDPLTL